jgi:hypothetical protein
MLTIDGIEQWIADRARQAAQHPDHTVRSRGDHYRRKNNGIALRTFQSIARWHDRIVP